MVNEIKKLTGGSVIGEFTDTIRHADGRVEVREGHNLIVNDIGKLIACLFKKESGYTGLGFWAIGSGQDAWDSSSVQPSVTDANLNTEFFRKAIPASNIKFLNPSNGESSTPTNKIGITLTFTENEANGKWREFSIFGGNATSSLNSGIMINHKIHGVLVKDNTMVIERQIRFTFN